MPTNQLLLDALRKALNVKQKKILYTAEINRKQPTAFVFLIDQSGSMNDKITHEGKNITKAELASNVLNETLNELLVRATKGTEIREYYEIALIGYGGKDNNEANFLWEGELANKEWCSIADINTHFVEMEEIIVTRKTRTGETNEKVNRKKWVTPIANKLTPMKSALEITNSLLEKWLVKYEGIDCYPPTVINITDGDATDAKADELIALSNKIKALHTMDGSVLMFNIHIATAAHRQTILPENINELPNDIYAQTLFSMSSQLPARYDEELKNLKGTTQRKIYTAMCFNADASQLIKIMNIGTTHTNQISNA